MSISILWKEVWQIHITMWPIWMVNATLKFWASSKFTTKTCQLWYSLTRNSKNTQDWWEELSKKQYNPLFWRWKVTKEYGEPTISSHFRTKIVRSSTRNWSNFKLLVSRCQLSRHRSCSKLGNRSKKESNRRLLVTRIQRRNAEREDQKRSNLNFDDLYAYTLINT